MSEKEALARIRKALDDKSTILNLNDLDLERLPTEIGCLTDLERLYLYNNKLRALPGEIGQLESLKRLDLDNNQLAELPEEIVQLANLEMLNLPGNLFLELPKIIAKLENLKSLSAYSNRLTVLPKEIGQLASLEGLNIRGNQLTILPKEIGQLKNLNQLGLQDNHLAELPREIGQLQNLTLLYLQGNKLKSLSEEIRHLTNLTKLDLRNNQLTSLPKEIRHLKILSDLNLGKNQLKELPGEIGHLKKLRKLRLNDNQLTSLPKEIGQLPLLEWLYLNANQLKSLPNEIGQLKNLNRLYLSDNQLEHLPPATLELKKLTKLGLGGNPLPISEEYFNPRLKDNLKGRSRTVRPLHFLNFYFSLLKGRRPLNEAKLILVGRGGVGKTSLVNRLVHNEFNRNESTTHGLEITKWLVRVNDDEKVTLNIWDFGGQEIMHATHQFFFTQRSLYLLVLNGREGTEDSDAEYWLRLISSFSENSAVIIVLNKVKDNPFDLDRRALQKKYPAIRGFVSTDCSGPTDIDPRGPIGIEKLFETIKNETNDLQHIRAPFPENWFAIKDRLADMCRQNENYISFDRYREICIENNEHDQSAQDSLAFYLHNLGIALNYKDDSRLRDMHVLNPHWVTDGIYRIITSSTLSARRGELRTDDLSTILDASKYPPERYSFLLELMRRFELCFSFPEEHDRYLIPQLLEKQEPSTVGEFDTEECLKFQYNYPIIPEGLLPRFIVRTHVLSNELPKWRNGVILRFEENLALVRAVTEDSRVQISVSGPSEGRRRLLAVIRSDFEHIHASYSFSPEE
ncbi:MAG: GTP-binding protein, partial [Proteobacteria bacterium]|nr:GTP-binding protein [Pseudomonadota bacterium]